MARNNIRVLKGGRTVQRFKTEANGYVGLATGDAVKIGGTGTNYAIPCLNGDPEQGTDIFLGVTKSDATNTASVDGVVDVELCVPGTIMELLATTVTNVNTAAKILGVSLDYLTFDRSADTAAGVLTLDEDETAGGDNDVHGMILLDVRVTDGMCYVTPGNAWIGRGAV
jgi:hypothetical protein